MSPKMIYLERALCNPPLHFNRLKEIIPDMSGNRPAISRTYHAAECRISLDGRRYLLYMPFRREMVDRTESLNNIIEGIAAKFIAPQQILRNEINIRNLFGEVESYDIILQEIPDGITLKEAMKHHSLPSIHYIVKALYNDMQRFYFTHGNLNLTNIIIDRDGKAHLLRYWYSEFGTYCQDNLSKLEALIDIHYPSSPPHATRELQPQPFTRKCYNGLIGWADRDGEYAIHPHYSWASEFTDGIALVAIEDKMGAIDTLGRIVVPIEYSDIEFDAEEGIFHARKGAERFTLNHRGEVIEQQ